MRHGRSNEHREVVVGEVDRADRVAEGVEDVVVSETVAAGAVDDHWIHEYQLSLTDSFMATPRSRAVLANGLLTEFPRTSRFSPSPDDTTIRETPAQTLFPDTRHHPKNAPGAISNQHFGATSVPWASTVCHRYLSCWAGESSESPSGNGGVGWIIEAEAPIRCASTMS